MKKLLFFIPLFLFASTFPNFRPCLEKYSFIKNSIPVTKTKSITFNKLDCINFDPFTGMCVIKHKNKKFIRFFKNPKLGWWAASVKKNEIYVGNFAKDEVFFNPALLSVKSAKNSVITDMFCRAIGIGRGDGFIRGDMVNHFVKYGYWGDAGLEADEDMKIVSFDPFYIKGLHIGDKILKINGKKATPEIFSKYVIQGIEGKKVVLNINGKNIKLSIRKKEYLYTPLNYFGIFIDKNLRITKLSNKIKSRYYIRPGAKIVKVDGKKVSNIFELNQLLSTYKNVTISVLDEGILINIPLR